MIDFRVCSPRLLLAGQSILSAIVVAAGAFIAMGVLPLAYPQRLRGGSGDG